MPHFVDEQTGDHIETPEIPWYGLYSHMISQRSDLDGGILAAWILYRNLGRNQSNLERLDELSFITRGGYETYQEGDRIYCIDLNFPEPSDILLLDPYLSSEEELLPGEEEPLPVNVERHRDKIVEALVHIFELHGENLEEGLEIRIFSSLIALFYPKSVFKSIAEEPKIIEIAEKLGISYFIEIVEAGDNMIRDY